MRGRIMAGETNGSAVTINGRLYDKKTGLPVTQSLQPSVAKTSSRTPQAPIHKARIQKSRTLSRSATKVPATQKKHHGHSMDMVAARRPHTAIKTPVTAPHPRAAKRTTTAATTPPSSSVKKFTPVHHQPNETKTDDIAPRIHPAAVKATALSAKKKAPVQQHRVQKSAATLKKEAIERALREASKTDTKELAQPRPLFKKKHTVKIIYAGVSTLAVAAVAVTAWINLPALQVQLAAAQSGVSANYPQYKPDGYSMSFPVEHTDDSVAMTFKANGGETHFTLSQSKSSWDSAAVREFVSKASNGQFLTTQDRGLTIYTYSGNAAWVNKGILYQINGDAQLPTDYVLKIANSL